MPLGLPIGRQHRELRDARRDVVVGPVRSVSPMCPRVRFIRQPLKVPRDGSQSKPWIISAKRLKTSYATS
ncbi:MAG: hypothetical protein WCP53_02270 [Verrucomicrobiota bacterium]